MIETPAILEQHPTEKHPHHYALSSFPHPNTMFGPWISKTPPWTVVNPAGSNEWPIGSPDEAYSWYTKTMHTCTTPSQEHVIGSARGFPEMLYYICYWDLLKNMFFVLVMEGMHTPRLSHIRNVNEKGLASISEVNFLKF